MIRRYVTVNRPRLAANKPPVRNAAVSEGKVEPGSYGVRAVYVVYPDSNFRVRKRRNPNLATALNPDPNSEDQILHMKPFRQG